MREYSKKEIVEEGIKYRTDLFKLVYSNHAKERGVERELGPLHILPTVVRITESNIISGVADESKKYLFKVKIKLKWKPGNNLYMVILPNKRLVKTLYFDK